MRDRLVELLIESELFNGADGKADANTIADHLLANGVIVPPCKVGDKMYVLGEDGGVYQIKEYIADFFDFEETNNLQAHVQFECDNDCEGCYFNSWSQTYCGEWSCGGEYGEGVVPADDFGKTVFLTRDEAERAMKGEHNAKTH